MSLNPFLKILSLVMLVTAISYSELPAKEECIQISGQFNKIRCIQTLSGNTYQVRPQYVSSTILKDLNIKVIDPQLHPIEKVAGELDLMLAAFELNGIAFKNININYQKSNDLDLQHNIYSGVDSLSRFALSSNTPARINIYFGKTSRQELTGFSYGKSWGQGSLKNTIWLTQNIYVFPRRGAYSSILAHELAHVILDEPDHSGAENILAPFAERSDLFTRSQIQSIKHSPFALINLSSKSLSSLEN